MRTARRILLASALLGVLLALWSAESPAADVDEAALRKAVTLYASFDEALKADYGGGDLSFWTRSTEDADKKKYTYEKGFDAKAFHVARDKGVAGGCLQATDLPPKNGRIYFPAKGNIAFKKGGWGGSLSVWINTDPNTLLKTKFCDPIQMTQKGANNGGIWFDFNDAKPRDMRMGAFPVIPEGGTGIKEEDPKAPMVRVKDVGFKSGDWHHIVLTWDHFDSGKKDALATLYVDAKKIGDVSDYAIAMDWELDKAGIYVAVNYIGLLDELALFNRPLSADEVAALHKKPGLLAPLKKGGMKEEEEVQETVKRLESLATINERDHGFMEEDLRPLRSRALRLLSTESGKRHAEHLIAALGRSTQRLAKLAEAPRYPFDVTRAQRYQNDYARTRSLPVEFTNFLGMTFVLIPPGTFLMGSSGDEPGHNSGGVDETLHEVTLTRPFYLCKTETTVAQFRRFVEATKYVTDVEKNGGGNAHDEKAEWKHRPGTSWLKPGYAGQFELREEHPVVHVSHTDALAFCRWLQEQAERPRALPLSMGYDLPTEAQWEWACRAGSAARFWWGADEDTTGKVANVGDRSLKKIHPEWPRLIMPMDDGHAFLAPVGSYQANGFGLHDMLGNVWEFCSTHYGPYPKEALTNPDDGDPKRGFAVRGGGWSNAPNDVRCATRNADPPHFGHSNLGFRVALRLPK
jgi:formylglycine-generating enzyme required for sulfatase activity